MDQFVSVRLVQANGLNLSQFQFDYDLTFSVFLMNADGTIYGRYGSRSERHDATKDISMEGFGKTLEAALRLHRDYPSNRDSLVGKQGAKPRFAVPEDYPSLRGKYTAKLDYEGKVVQSCIHCHQVREADRKLHREARAPIPDDILYPWPMPDVAGLHMDPLEKARITEVKAGSSADQAGFQPGDELVRLNGQSIISTADIQWVLHHAPDEGVLSAQVLRSGTTLNLPITLKSGWRRNSDISWRVSSWDLRRMATGGLLLRDATPEEKSGAGLSTGELALAIEHVGQYGEHAVAKKAGFEKGDIILSVDGITEPMTESRLFGLLLRGYKTADKVPMQVYRNGKRLSLMLPMQ